MIDYYKILNVPQDSSQDLIRKAFRKSAKHTHPDLFPGDTPAEKKKRQVLFVQLTQAYEILSDEKRRTEYDKQKLQHSKKTTKPKNQTRKASTSSSYQKQSEPFKKQKKSPDSINQPEEAVQDAKLTLKGHRCKNYHLPIAPPGPRPIEVKDFI